MKSVAQHLSSRNESSLIRTRSLEYHFAIAFFGDDGMTDSQQRQAEQGVLQLGIAKSYCHLQLSDDRGFFRVFQSPLP